MSKRDFFRLEGLKKHLIYVLGRSPDEYGLIPDEYGFVKSRNCFRHYMRNQNLDLSEKVT